MWLKVRLLTLHVRAYPALRPPVNFFSYVAPLARLLATCDIHGGIAGSSLVRVDVWLLICDVDSLRASKAAVLFLHRRGATFPPLDMHE